LDRAQRRLERPDNALFPKFQGFQSPHVWMTYSPTPNSPPARSARSAVAEMHVRGFGSRRPLGTAIVLLRKSDHPPGGAGSQGSRKCRQRSATQAVFVGTPSTRGGSPVSSPDASNKSPGNGVADGKRQPCGKQALIGVQLQRPRNAVSQPLRCAGGFASTGTNLWPERLPLRTLLRRSQTE
jgi:hypothetical protein